MTPATNLDHEQRRTLERLYGHPLPHNLKWPQALALLRALSEEFVELSDRCRVTIDGHTEVFRRPRHADLPVDMVVKVRRFLTATNNDPAQFA